MSRVHDALRRAEQAASANANEAPAKEAPAREPSRRTAALQGRGPEPPAAVVVEDQAYSGWVAAAVAEPPAVDGLLSRIQEIAFNPSPEAHLIDASKPHEAPSEEFRSLRTRLNHMQSQQPMHTLVVTSASPAEGKSFAAVNLALAEAQLDSNPTLLVDCDFRRPVVHSLFQVGRTPGITDYLLGKAPLEACIKKVAGTNLYILPAGEAVINPLELLNLREVKTLLDELPKLFNWVILDSPPLLFAADANLLSTLSDGAILVVRIGSTTIDSVTRAMQSLCENNVLGIVVNGARRGELYSKYTYYHSYYYTKPEEDASIEAAKPI